MRKRQTDARRGALIQGRPKWGWGYRRIAVRASRNPPRPGLAHLRTAVIAAPEPATASPPNGRSQNLVRRTVGSGMGGQADSNKFRAQRANVIDQDIGSEHSKGQCRTAIFHGDTKGSQIIAGIVITDMNFENQTSSILSRVVQQSEETTPPVFENRRSGRDGNPEMKREMQCGFSQCRTNDRLAEYGIPPQAPERATEIGTPPRESRTPGAERFGDRISAI